MPLDRIVCATDFSTDAGAALRRAAMLAAEHQATLEVLHVVSRESLDALRRWVTEPVEFPERLVRAVQEELEGCAAGASRQAGVRIETRVVVGEVTQTIVEHAAASDLLVIGAHGTNPLKDLVLGTTAERLAGRATTPILVVRMPPEHAYTRLLVAVDLLPGSEEAFAAALAFAGNATITVLHVYDVPFAGMLSRAGVAQSVVDEHRARAHQEALDRIEACARSVSGDASRFLGLAERGHPAATIVERSHAIGADLVVIRKRARSLAEAIVLGSVTRHVLADAATDVLLLAESRR
jgi:nucleotide-binding universal stress UspA family protein